MDYLNVKEIAKKSILYASSMILGRLLSPCGWDPLSAISIRQLQGFLCRKHYIFRTKLEDDFVKSSIRRLSYASVEEYC